jgi:hypothetical protein
LLKRLYPLAGGVVQSADADANTLDDSAANFDLAIEVLQAAGLKYVTQFEQREAKLIVI